ncbi:MAG TPA: hypothetical protein VMA32_02865 [Streptosporangiaceae bacterium]|nr:hypothetical protein [Streptosporangiaceae bacterium]
MRFIRILATAGSLVAAGVITASGLAAASAAPAGRAAPSGTEHFQLISASATATKGPVIAYGLFGAAGIDHMGNNVDTFAFKGGTFKVRHSQGTGTPHLNPQTCVFTIHVHGTYKIFGGTGTYAGISGHGHYVYSQLAITKRKANGSCNTSQNALPAAVQQIIQASGPVKL